MLILTSNEDVIRHFSSNKIPDTYLIHLHDDKPILINEDDRKVIQNLPFLQQLTEPVRSKFVFFCFFVEDLI